GGDAMRSGGATASRSEGGQALIEFGVILVLFVTIALGLMTFGHAFMVANMITHAARDGARLAATWPNRGTCGVLTNKDPIIAAVQNEIDTVSGEPFVVTVSQNPTPPGGTPCGAPATPMVEVNVTGCVAYVFPIMPRSLGTPCPSGRVGFNVNRTVVFHDEG